MTFKKWLQSKTASSITSNHKVTYRTKARRSTSWLMICTKMDHKAQKTQRLEIFKIQKCLRPQTRHLTISIKVLIQFKARSLKRKEGTTVRWSLPMMILMVLFELTLIVSRHLLGWRIKLPNKMLAAKEMIEENKKLDPSPKARISSVN